MGWQQYSRRLWLSRGNPHILYLKAINRADACLVFLFHRPANGTGFHWSAVLRDSFDADAYPGLTPRANECRRYAATSTACAIA